jgi:hypothetical protein
MSIRLFQRWRLFHNKRQVRGKAHLPGTEPRVLCCLRSLRTPHSVDGFAACEL